MKRFALSLVLTALAALCLASSASAAFTAEDHLAAIANNLLKDGIFVALLLLAYTLVVWLLFRRWEARKDRRQRAEMWARIWGRNGHR